MSKTPITFPVGRLVQGNVYKGNTTDSKGVALVVKTGPNKGQSMTQFYFAVAISKTPGHTHWSQTDWGQKVLQVGAEGYPAQYQGRAFSWKIEDGDSVEPNKNGRKPADNEGWKGCWVVKFSGSYGAPRIVQRDATGRPVDFMVPDAIKLGYYIQVGGECADNKPSESPGVYMNYSAVMFVGVGPEIYVGPDMNAMFGTVAAPLPAGATAAPVGMAVMPVMAAPTPGMAAPTPVMAAPTPVMVAPNTAFLGIPAPAGAAPLAAPVPLPAVPAAPAGPTPTTKLIGIGHTYEAMRAAGWTDDALRVAQYIV